MAGPEEIVEIDGQDPEGWVFKNARSFGGRSGVKAVRLPVVVAVTTLLGREVGQVGDYLVRDRETGHASLVCRSLFEELYFDERELDGTTRKPQRRTYSIQ